MNFERIDSKNNFEQLTLDKAFEKAKSIIEEAEIKPEDFSDVYGTDEIRNDVQYVERMEREFEDRETLEQKKHKKLATVFEAIVHEHAELSEWFGPDAETIKPSRYDDIKNGVDTIAELKEGGKSVTHLAMGIDVTFSHDAEKKFKRIKQEIENGTLAEVKYFHSEYMGVRERLPNVPRVVIGADEKTIRELSAMWLEGRKRELGNHPIQFQILEEIADQLKVYKAYAETVHRPDIAAMYEKAMRSIRDIRKKKGATMKDSGARDSVFYALEENLSLFK